MSAVAVTGVGLRTPLGSSLAALAAADGPALVAHPPLAALPSSLAGVVARDGAERWLKRRKDGKLMTRAARMALAAAGEALGAWPGDRLELGLFLGVGREPPDEGEAEPALAAACRDGLLDEALLAGRGRDLYPPLLPLKTLPNMALAHISIHLGIGGENGAWAGDGDASTCALQEAWWSVAEGRVPAALAGGADSLVDLGSARDRLRMGGQGAPGEAAVIFLLEPLVAARARGATVLATLARAPAETGRWGDLPWRAWAGDAGAAEGAAALAVAVARMSSATGPLARAMFSVAPAEAW